MTTPEMVITCTLRFTFGWMSVVWGPPPKTRELSNWPNFTFPQLFLITAGEVGQPSKHMYITKWDIGVNNLASSHGGRPNYFTSGSCQKVVWWRHQTLSVGLIATESEECPQEQPRSGITRGLFYQWFFCIATYNRELTLGAVHAFNDQGRKWQWNAMGAWGTGVSHCEWAPQIWSTSGIRWHEHYIICKESARKKSIRMRSSAN